MAIEIQKNLTKLMNMSRSQCGNVFSVCVTGLLVVLYIILATPDTPVYFFNTVFGKIVAMLVLLFALAVDVRLGVLVAVAIATSMCYACVGQSESFTSETSEDDVDDDEEMEDSEEAMGEEEGSGAVAEPYEDYEDEDAAEPDVALDAEDDEEMDEKYMTYAPVNFDSDS